ncbi:hemin ABC transporter, periplasmic hemin-binding protein [Myxococcus xanthus DK 1622]|uniref:Hemin ABC transporter, periplasmic hemin-binding protein n=1 Tax=Myxococcus xanthus (strain DK1622) TaxID=246197 RepID=Q1DCP7_MYXXD|nr:MULTISPECIES: ABC transporter substrate-binding protein [Myxococcus]ABF90147.1 hemin ABC transporter, periplasmic hemin-binding protein [Myxococcus xanthus DK 1622]NOJ56396.1 ABC transporter substrate-binding protein [Myxococcus xanthus]QPM80961.1 ABC transporter substrate-binding protein [Myxococcus xanthus]QVW70020.1 ABC transporter substrate-binding protein [Myxococcus xanthus DZ2]QZZ48850.1 Hemin-binding periplasmic protein HmuT [Myxococcus xanthus]
MSRAFGLSWVFMAVASLAHAAAPAPAKPPAAAAAKAPVNAAKLVTVGPAITETVFALGAGGQVVGVDDTSLALEVARKSPKVGYQRALSSEAIVALGTSQLLASEEAGPPGVLEQLKTVGVDVVVLPNKHTVEATRERIRTLAQRLGKAEQGEALVKQLDSDLRKAQERTAARKDAKPPRVLALYARGANVLMVAGAGTAAGELVTLSGGVNAIAGYAGHKPLTAEAVVEAAPDFILMPASSLEPVGGEEGLSRTPGLSQVRGWRLITVDDVHFMGLGPHLGKAVSRLQDGYTSPARGRK